MRNQRRCNLQLSDRKQGRGCSTRANQAYPGTAQKGCVVCSMKFEAISRKKTRSDCGCRLVLGANSLSIDPYPDTPRGICKAHVTHYNRVQIIRTSKSTNGEKKKERMKEGGRARKGNAAKGNRGKLHPWNPFWPLTSCAAKLNNFTVSIIKEKQRVERERERGQTVTKQKGR